MPYADEEKARVYREDRNRKFINVAVDRDTHDLLEQLAEQYAARHPKRAKPGKTGLIRTLVLAAARQGFPIDQLGPLPGLEDRFVSGPGRNDWQQP